MAQILHIMYSLPDTLTVRPRLLIAQSAYTPAGPSDTAVVQT